MKLYQFVIQDTIGCEQIDCIYGEKVLDSLNRCICQCFDRFYGLSCNLFNTSVLETSFDSVERNDISCTTLGSESVGKCPIKCLCKFLLLILKIFLIKKISQLKFVRKNRVKMELC